MRDEKIIELYNARDESAIDETKNKYGKYIYTVAYNLLSSREDAEECVNDTYVAAWQSMPEERPTYLGAFLSKITRRISVSRYRASHTQKRGGASVLIEELSECIPSSSSVEAEYENGRLKSALERFLGGLDEKKRAVFIRRYFYSQPIEQISKAMGMKVGSVKSVLSRTRQSLREMLEKEGVL